MKTKTKLFAVLLSIILLLCGCATTNSDGSAVSNEPADNIIKYDCGIYEVGGYDQGIVENHKSEIDLSTKTTLDISAKEDASIQLFGKALKGSYKKTEKSLYYDNFQIDYFGSSEIQNGVCEFAIRSDTGDCVFYVNAPLDYLDHVKSSIKTDDECRAIAESFFSKYSTDDNPYVMEWEKYDESDRYGGLYTFTFSKKVDGMLTNDRGTVAITGYGDIISYNTKWIGSIQCSKLPDSYNETKIQSDLQAKLNEIYNGDIWVNISFAIKEYRLSKINGQLSVMYSYDVTLTPQDGVSVVDTAQFVVFLE